MKLTKEFTNHQNIKMACMGSEEIEGKIVFTYKITNGVAPYLSQFYNTINLICFRYSYGIKVAERADIPQEILDEAQTMAAHLENFLRGKQKSKEFAPSKLRPEKELVKQVLSLLESGPTPKALPSLISLQRRCPSLLKQIKVP